MKNLLPIIFVIVSIGAIFGYVKPMYSTIQDERAELSSYKDTLGQAEMLESKVTSLQSKVDSLNPEDMKKLEKLLPDSVNNVNLIIDINNIASSTGLKIRNLNIEQPAIDQQQGATPTAPALPNAPSKEIYDSIDLSFNVTSSYEGFLIFIGALEKSVRLVDITDVSFSPAATGDSYDFKVTVRTYWLKK